MIIKQSDLSNIHCNNSNSSEISRMTCRGSWKIKYIGYGFLLYLLFSLLELLFVVLEAVPMLTPQTQPECPPPYILAVGDVSGPGSVDIKTHVIRNISR